MRAPEVHLDPRDRPASCDLQAIPHRPAHTSSRRSVVRPFRLSWQFWFVGSHHKFPSVTFWQQAGALADRPWQKTLQPRCHRRLAVMRQPQIDKETTRSIPLTMDRMPIFQHVMMTLHHMKDSKDRSPSASRACAQGCARSASGGLRLRWRPYRSRISLPLSTSE